MTMTTPTTYAEMAALLTQESRSGEGIPVRVTVKELGRVLETGSPTGRTPLDESHTVPAVLSALLAGNPEWKESFPRYLFDDESGAKPFEAVVTDGGSGSDGEATPRRKPRVVEPGSVAAFVQEFREMGYAGMKLEDLDILAPDLKGRHQKLPGVQPMDEKVAEALRPTLEVLAAISTQLQEDRQAVKDWDVPDPSKLMAQSGTVFRYVAICGHKAQITRQLFHERFMSNNANVPAAFYLCDTCRAVRAALLDLLPGAANPESVCSVCGEFTFGGNTAEKREMSHAKSRGDVYDNLIAGVLPLSWLPGRLNSKHRDNHPKHANLVTNEEAFLAWAEELMLNVGMLCMSHPDKARYLKADAAKSIDEKAAELKIPTALVKKLKAGQPTKTVPANAGTAKTRGRS